ncbi:hypothetical protein CSC17_3955 [Klebsiella oxytoca]|nr:hypothetical protein CSC17_3955 [Klebsiella oxytoca]
MRRFLPHEMFYFVMNFKDMNRRKWVMQAGRRRPAWEA